MVDVDTFLTTLYVMVDDFCKTSLPPQTILACGSPEPQRDGDLAIFGQWQGFGSERGFYRYAQRSASCLPQLPTREQFNRQVCQHSAALVACFLYLAGSWLVHCLYEALDSSGIPTRRQGRGAVLVGRA